MKNKKDNSGGKKFQSRLPEEKRVRVKTKSSSDKKEFGKKESGFSRPGKFSGTDKPKRTFKKDDGQKPYGKFKTGESGYKDKRKFSDTKSGDFSGSDRPKRTFKKEGPKSFGNFKSSEGGYKDRRRSGEGKPGEFPEKKFGRTGGPKWKKGPEKERKSGKEFVRDNARQFRNKPDNYKGGGKKYSKTAVQLNKSATDEKEEVRLNRYIANSGLCSRREADVMISQGLVSVNGNVVQELGVKVRKGDDVRVDGKRINPETPVYILLNKPKGYITTTSDPSERATVMELIDLPGKERIYPVGRLDRNTTGVLLLTNDGELAQKLMHPSFEIKKIYKAGLDKKPAKEHMLAWVNGVELEDGFMSFEQIGFVDEEDPSVLGLEVHSGRNRIVRRMFEHFGYEVKSLDRVMLGEFDHLKLGRGKWRFLNEKEIQYVERLKRMKPKKNTR